MRLVTRLLDGLDDEYRKQSEQQCFVAHEFVNREIRARLTRILASSNLKPYFADAEVTGNLMLKKICGKIVATRAFVVDLSTPNANVYFELGLAVGLNKPILAIMKSGSTVPEILLDFVNHRFTYYSELEQDLSKQMPVWFAGVTENDALYTSHCHFLNRSCDDRNRLSPGQVFFLIDEVAGPPGDQRRAAPHVDPDLRKATELGLQRFNFELRLIDQVENYYGLNFCNICHASRDAAFAVVNLSQHTAPAVFLFAGLFVGLGINPLFLVHRAHAQDVDSAVPTLLRGLDYLPYQYPSELEELLPTRLEVFLNEQTQPLIDRVLVDMPIESEETPQGKVLFWSLMEAGPDHASLIEKHVDEMFSEGFPRMLAYVYIGPSGRILSRISQYLYHSLGRTRHASYFVFPDEPKSFNDNEAIQQAVLDGFQVGALSEISGKVSEKLNRSNSPNRTLWLVHELIKRPDASESSLANYLSWIDNHLVPSLPEGVCMVTQLFVQSRKAATFAPSLAAQLRSSHQIPRSVVRIANDIKDDRKSRQIWESLLFNETNCG